MYKLRLRYKRSDIRNESFLLQPIKSVDHPQCWIEIDVDPIPRTDTHASGQMDLVAERLADASQTSVGLDLVTPAWDALWFSSVIYGQYVAQVGTVRYSPTDLHGRNLSFCPIIARPLAVCQRPGKAWSAVRILKSSIRDSCGTRADRQASEFKCIVQVFEISATHGATRN